MEPNKTANGSWQSLVNKMAEYVPFTASNSVWRFLGNSDRGLLDVGCGSGRVGGIIKRHRPIYSVGADVFPAYLKLCRENQTHDELVRCDVRHLPFRKRSFDTVLCKEVIEHLDIQDGDKLIKELEHIARRQVIITTPVGNYEQHEYDDNPFQEHRSARKPTDLKRHGFTVRGVGIRSLHGERGFQSRLPRPVRWLTDILYVLAGPVVYFFPNLACYMVCSKKIEN
jgi:SAM-dependent methyltransferase